MYLFKGMETSDEMAALDSDLALRQRLKHYATPDLLVIDLVGYARFCTAVNTRCACRASHGNRAYRRSYKFHGAGKGAMEIPTGQGDLHRAITIGALSVSMRLVPVRSHTYFCE